MKPATIGRVRRGLATLKKIGICGSLLAGFVTLPSSASAQNSDNGPATETVYQCVSQIYFITNLLEEYHADIDTRPLYRQTLKAMLQIRGRPGVDYPGPATQMDVDHLLTCFDLGLSRPAIMIALQIISDDTIPMIAQKAEQCVQASATVLAFATYHGLSQAARIQAYDEMLFQADIAIAELKNYAMIDDETEELPSWATKPHISSVRAGNQAAHTSPTLEATGQLDNLDLCNDVGFEISAYLASSLQVLMQNTPPPQSDQGESQ